MRRFHLYSLLVPAIACCMLTVSACRNEVVYHRYSPIPLTGWDKRDTIDFDIPPFDSTQTYKLTLELRTSSAFPYRNCWLVAEQRLEDPVLVRRDTVCCTLSTPQGSATGQGVNLYTNTYPVFAEPRTQGQHGRIRVYHIMRREEVPGISDVGLRLSTATVR